MSDEPLKPIRAGQAYLESIRNDPAAQAALRRVQAQVHTFGEAVRRAIEPANAARDAFASTISQSAQVYHQLGAALGEMLRDCQFERLRDLVNTYPQLKLAADELEQAVQDAQRIRAHPSAEIEQRLRHVQTVLPDLCSATPPAFDDPGFWSSITPLGEQIRDAVRDGMRAQTPAESTAPVSADDAQRRAEAHIKHHDFPGVNALAKQCGCSPSTIRKAISQSEKLQRAQAAQNLRKPGTRPQVANDASWAAQVDEALRQLIEYAQESERAKLNTPDVRTQLAKMAPDALAGLVDDAREQAEQRKRAAARAPAGRAQARTDDE